MIIANFVRWLVDSIGRRRAKQLVGKLEHFLQDGESVLDIGAGGGWNGERIHQEKKCNVTLLDISSNLNRTQLPLLLYDGTTIPFADNSFDTSLLLFVLHHCQDPAKVLKEAVRVSKKRVIIMEDTFGSWFGRILLCCYDTFENFPALLVEPSYKMNLPHNFKKVPEWKEAFEHLGLKLVHTEHIQRFPITQILFILEK
ncbi:class I SAM-dependent methyltransferase [Patescibacteria group bacterium]|nr:class I SAM-dependent methyltransferase [Patescibacteria group bacterium]